MGSKETHEGLGLATVLDLHVRLPAIGNNLEREVLHVRLDLGIVELEADEALRVKYGVDGVHRDLVLRGVADKAPGIGEGDIGRGWCSYPGCQW